MSNTGNHSENSEQEIFQLFNCLDLNQDGQINKWDLVNALEDTGLWRTDPRVKDIYDKGGEYEYLLNKHDLTGESIAKKVMLEMQ